MSLDYKLEHIVKFSEETEYKSLYPWCLREFDKDGKQIGSDQIPWGWGADFFIVDLTFNIEFGQEREFARSKVKGSQPLQERTIQKRERLYGRLVPKECGSSAFRTTRYSFFGTNRAINDFTILIVEGEVQGEEEIIHIWGNPQYDYEIDFVDETAPDNLQISLVLTSEHFHQIADLVKAKSIDQGSLHLTGVDGFYSEWSPSISTDDIKVLPREKDAAKVEFPRDKQEEIPRLGGAAEFKLFFDLKSTMNNVQAISDDEEGRYDIRDDLTLKGRLKDLLTSLQSDDSSPKPIGDWQYSPLVQQFSIIYNQARSSLVRAGKDDLIDDLFYDLKGLVYGFRYAVGQEKTDKRNATKPNNSTRQYVHVWLTRDLADLFRNGTESASAFPDDLYGFDDLDQVAQEYFSRHWKSSYFEKLLCEAFISLEAFLFAQHTKENITSLSKQNYQFSFDSFSDELSDWNIARKNNYNMEKMTKAFWKRTLIRFGRRLFFFVGLPSLAAIVFYVLDNDFSDGVVGVSIGIVSLYIFYHVIRFVFQLIFAGIRKGLGIEPKETGLDKAHKLLTRMTLTYTELARDYPSPQRMISRLEKDSEEGISYRGIIFSILQRAADDKNYLWGSEVSEV